MVPQDGTYTTELAAYDALGFKMIRLDMARKKGIDLRWNEEDTRISLEAAEKHIARGGGIGIQAGECSDWLCAVDLDYPEAQELAPRFLRKTARIFKEHDPQPGAYVYISEGAAYRKIKDPDTANAERGEILSIQAAKRGEGHQWAVPPSVHPTKGRYVWEGGFNPSTITKISAEELDMQAGRLGCATLVARHLPKRGGRHDYAMAWCGLLLGNGEDTDGARELMYPAWELAGASPEAFRDLDGIIEDTKEKIDAGEPYKGGRTLNELVPRLAGAAAKALGWGKPRGVEHKNYARTDMGNAERLVDTFGEHIRYCYPWKSWLLWDGSRWARDGAGKIHRLAKSVARQIHEDATRAADTAEQKEIGKWAITSQSEKALNAMVSLARPEVAIAPEELDADPMLLTVENGTLDLRTGELRASRPEDFITKLAPVRYDAAAASPRFEQFLTEIFPGDEELRSFVRRFAGYTLTGSTAERCMAILHGGGKNGKSTLVELLRDLMGHYGRATPTETLLQSRSNGAANNEVAALKGARFVSAAEVEKNRRLAESKVKELTGSDTVSARFLFQELFDFKPEFKLWLSTNNKPEITGTDDAIWDRIRLIPFNVRFEGESSDADLPRKLRDEAAGVLAWMVRGCLEWQSEGLGTPDAVMAATQEYRAEMDTFAAFLDEECVIGEHLAVRVAELYPAYHSWCLDNDESPLNKRDFNKEMKARNFKPGQVSSGTYKGNKTWEGLDLHSNDPDPGRKPATFGESSGIEAKPATAQSSVGKPKPPPTHSMVAEVAGKFGNFRHDEPREEKDSEKPATLATRYSEPPHDHICESWHKARKDEGDYGQYCKDCGLPYQESLAREKAMRARERSE